MKRLLILTVVALIPLVAGCRGMSGMKCHRGDACSSCTTSSYSMPSFSSQTPVYQGTILPAPSVPAELPGPAPAT